MYSPPGVEAIVHCEGLPPGIVVVLKMEELSVRGIAWPVLSTFHHEPFDMMNCGPRPLTAMANRVDYRKSGIEGKSRKGNPAGLHAFHKIDNADRFSSGIGYIERIAIRPESHRVRQLSDLDRARGISASSYRRLPAGSGRNS